jgi:hypothetical protein
MPVWRRAAQVMTVAFLLADTACAGGGEGSRPVPAGHLRNESHYIVMRDSVRLAIDIWYPPDLTTGQRVGTVVYATRYGRAFAATALGRSIGGLVASFRHRPAIDQQVEAFNRSGMAVVSLDVRGSGASFGHREMEWSPTEIADYGQLVDWIVAQPWSNGRVGAVGVSYIGNAAELFAATGRRAVRAVAPLFSDFDPAASPTAPGGVLNTGFIHAWGAANAGLDAGDICRFGRIAGLKCWLVRRVIVGVKPVDGDSGAALLRAAIRVHAASYDVLAAINRAASVRDPLAPSGLSVDSVSPCCGQRQAIERSGVPMFVRAGWLDAGSANGALARFLTQTNPQEVEIGPWSHGGGHHIDPFLPADTPTEPPMAEQTRTLVAFFARYLTATRDSASVAPVRRISYYTMNDGHWHTTPSWPPAGVAMQRWYLNDGHTLGLVPVPTAPDNSSDGYIVDFGASTGTANRWATQEGGGDVIYDDRRIEDAKLLCYTSAVLTRDLEITGVPVATLFIASSATDGAFHVYLEDVSPAGRVTYLTEGALRARDRHISLQAPYHTLAPFHSLSAADATPLIPNVMDSLVIELQATSVRLRAGHRLRFAIAGADASTFERIPASGAPPAIRVYRSAPHLSSVEIPTAHSPE